MAGTTTVRRKAALDFVATFTQHITLKTEAARLTKRSNTLKDRLKGWMPGFKDVYRNENGSYFVDLPETVEVGGKQYSGMELRRSVSTKFDEETAEKVLRRKNIYDECTVPVLDQDKIYAAYQEDKITERELDSMFPTSESFAFWPVEGEVED